MSTHRFEYDSLAVRSCRLLDLTPGTVRFQLMSPSAVRLIMISRDGASISHTCFIECVRNVRCAEIFGHQKKHLLRLRVLGNFVIVRSSASNVNGCRVSETHRDENEWPSSDPVGKSPTSMIEGPAKVEGVFWNINEAGSKTTHTCSYFHQA